MTKLEERIGYTFRDASLLSMALTHSSYANEAPGAVCNERLEFLGDAVLEVVSSDFLYHAYPDYPEGRLTRLRAALVCEQALAEVADGLGLREALFLGKGEEKNGGRRLDSIAEDAVEALIGAIYLDGGMESASTFIRRFVLREIGKRELFYDAKTLLQELVQAEGKSVTYELISESGPSHQKTYEMSCRVDETEYGRGSGSSKKSAQQQAAYQAIQVWKQRTEKECI